MSGGGPRAVVVGGGLAGLVAARHLARAGLAVELFEAADRLGGKAGSDWTELPGALGYHSDHGYHVFPAWYHNTWALIRELGIDADFQRRRDFWRLRPPAGGRAREGWRLRAALRPAVIRPGSLLVAVDLVSRPEAELEDLSLAEFIESRRYRGPRTGDELRDIALKGLGNPAEDVSALTFRANMRLLLPVLLRPNWTATHGSLQERFVNPLAGSLRDRVAVHTDTPVRGLELTGAGDDLRVEALVLGEGQRVVTADQAVVLTVPHGPAADLLGPPDRLPEGLRGLDRLESRRMVAADVHLGRRLSGLPAKGHVILDGSDLHLTVLDIRPVWRTGLPGDPDATVLQVIAADTRHLDPDEDPVSALVVELRRFFPGIADDDIVAVAPHPNDDVPLFMNVKGTDRFRPDSATRHGANLYVAGDWTANPVSLACMEGAVVSAGLAARAVLDDLAVDGRRPDLDLPSTAPSRRARVIRTLAAPLLWLLGRPVDLARRLRARPR